MAISEELELTVEQYTPYPVGAKKTSTIPKMDGEAAIGNELTYAAGDHVHPSDTTKIPKTAIGAADGVCPLDASGKVLEDYIPTSIISDISSAEEDITVLSARIDAIATLEEGSTTGDAELIDGRVGADGTTYDNIGGAIRGQVSDLKSALNLIGEDDITLFGIPFTTEGAINSSGNVQSIAGYTIWAYCDYILIPYGAKIIETNAVSASSSLGLAFYDSNKNFVSGSFVSNYSSPTIPIADTYKYVRLTSYNANSTHNINVKFISNKAKTEKSIALACDGVYTYSNINFTTEKGIGTSGLVVNATGATTWACSDFLTIPPHSKVFKTNAVSASSSLGLAFYDDNKKYITNSFLGSYASPTIALSDTYKYVRITSYKADSDHSTVVVSFESGNSLERVGIHNETGKNLADVIKNATILTGTYTLNSVLELGDNQSLIGADCIVNVSDGGQIKMRSGSSVTGIKFVGSWNPTRESGDGQTYTSYGYVPLISYDDLSDENSDALFGEGLTYNNAVIYMVANDSYNCRVDGCIFENFDRLAIFAGGRRHQEKDNVVVCNCYFSDCRMGIYVHGEFVRIYANEYLRCIVGCYLFGGNSNNYGEIFKCCDVAYYMPSNAVAHNEITSIEAAHCGLAGLYIKTLLAKLGCQITGSHFPDAPIVGESVNNLMFVGCRLDTWFKYDSGQHNAIMCSNIAKGYLYGKTLFDVPSDTLITLNRGLGTVPDADVNWS